MAAQAGETIKAVGDSPPAPEGDGGGKSGESGDFNLDSAKSMDDVRKELDKLLE